MLLYIDAGTGGMMVQVLFSGALGFVVFFKLAAKRIADVLFRRGRTTASEDATAVADGDSADPASDISRAA
ncbi:MAG TPA: hypothetical protein VFC53_12870 [Dehalococcoidia bacterium]|nr:hypothetical protein [Dehalococcoidia bacterium]